MDRVGPLAFQFNKVAQRAIVMVLELVYERDFFPCSYGFRPGRSAHQALQDLHTGFMSHGLRWVIDLDIENYFGSSSHSHLLGACTRPRRARGGGARAVRIGGDQRASRHEPVPVRALGSSNLLSPP